MKTLDWLNRKLVGKPITYLDGSAGTVAMIEDWQCEDRQVGIRQAYAWGADSNGNQVICFADGEVQDDDGVIIGNLDFEWEEY